MPSLSSRGRHLEHRGPPISRDAVGIDPHDFLQLVVHKVPHIIFQIFQIIFKSPSSMKIASNAYSSSDRNSALNSCTSCWNLSFGFNPAPPRASLEPLSYWTFKPFIGLFISLKAIAFILVVCSLPNGRSRRTYSSVSSPGFSDCTWQFNSSYLNGRMNELDTDLLVPLSLALVIYLCYPLSKSS